MARKKKKKNSFECFEEYANLTLEQLDILQKMLNKVSFQLMIATDDDISEKLEKERDEIQDKINTVMEEYNEVSEDYQQNSPYKVQKNLPQVLLQAPSLLQSVLRLQQSV